MASEEAWTVVTSKRGRGKRQNRAVTHQASSTSAQAPPAPEGRELRIRDSRPVDPAEVTLTQRRVNAALLDIADLNFTETLLAATLKDLSSGSEPNPSPLRWRELVAYGVGPVSSSARARAQFAAAEVLRRRLEVTEAWWYDPVCSATDIAVVKSYGWRLITSDEEAKRAVRMEVDDDKDSNAPGSPSGTIFFMPHCPFRLYSNVLWKNWPFNFAPPSPGLSGDTCVGLETTSTKTTALERCCIVGNSFDAYDTRTLGSAVDATNCVLRLLPYTHEMKLSVVHPRDAELLGRHSVGIDVFGDLAVMRWQADGLRAAHSNGALNPPPPEVFGVSHGA